MVICPSCGKENDEQAKFCGFCGYILPEEGLLAAPQEFRSDETVKASPLFLKEIERKVQASAKPQPQPQQNPVSKGNNPWTWPLLLLAVAALVWFAWFLINRPPAVPPEATTTASEIKINSFNPTATATETPTPTPPPSPTLPPTATVSPTVAASPSPTVTPVGIGMRRQELASIYLNLGFAFHETSPVSGQPRWIGKSIDKTCTLEIVGDPKDIIRATLITGQSYVGDQDMVSQSYRLRFFKKLVPDWAEGETWMNAGLRKLADSKENAPQVTTSAGNRIIILSVNKELGLTILSIQGAPVVPAGQ